MMKELLSAIERFNDCYKENIPMLQVFKASDRTSLSNKVDSIIKSIDYLNSAKDCIPIYRNSLKMLENLSDEGNEDKASIEFMNVECPVSEARTLMLQSYLAIKWSIVDYLTRFLLVYWGTSKEMQNIDKNKYFGTYFLNSKHPNFPEVLSVISCDFEEYFAVSYRLRNSFLHSAGINYWLAEKFAGKDAFFINSALMEKDKEFKEYLAFFKEDDDDLLGSLKKCSMGMEKYLCILINTTSGFLNTISKTIQ